ncbi:hypothetical protein GQ44DRAFT_323357 [Phaeosphaeriaceae sp. PMI808]|nr:hypothetical protein GQ44DRAFT_323357 [Phaeosphaeriaceae sp. PMI808]
MNYINRRKMGSNTNEKPFNARQTGKTMAKGQMRCLWRIQQVVGEEVGESEEEEEEGEVEGEEEEEEEEELGEEEEELLERYVLVLLLSLLDHQLKDNDYRSVLVSSIAVLGVDSDCSWKSPLVYNLRFQHFTIAKMLVLYSAAER